MLRPASVDGHPADFNKLARLCPSKVRFGICQNSLKVLKNIEVILVIGGGYIYQRVSYRSRSRLIVGIDSKWDDPSQKWFQTSSNDLSLQLLFADLPVPPSVFSTAEAACGPGYGPSVERLTCREGGRLKIKLIPINCFCK